MKKLTDIREERVEQEYDKAQFYHNGGEFVSKYIVGHCMEVGFNLAVRVLLRELYLYQILSVAKSELFCYNCEHKISHECVKDRIHRVLQRIEPDIW